ncbi:MAG: diguanylate cyclase [Coriobacteriales bacterium]|nr:diguanylate cyclase [Coriobacteriales bacterium]
MTRTQNMCEDEVRAYMASITLAHIMGFELDSNLVHNMVLVLGDLDTNSLLLFSDPHIDDGGQSYASHTDRFSVFLHDSIVEKAISSHRLRVDAFFNLQYMRHSLGQGIHHDSLSFDLNMKGEVYHILAGMELERDKETGHVLATIAFLNAESLYANDSIAAPISHYDSLTGTLTRVALSDIIHEYIFDHVDGPAVLAVVDIDSFHLINERYGFGFGDRVLMSLADDLRGTFSPDVQISRLGTDRFVLFFPDTSLSVAEKRVHDFVSRPHNMLSRNSSTYQYTVSAGLSIYPESAYTYDELVGQSCEALRAAQSDENSNLLVFDEDTLATYQSKRELSVGELIENIPAAIFVYEASGAERVVYANQRTVHLFGCESFDDFMDYTGGTFKGIVHPDDYVRVNREIWSQIRGVTHDNKDFCRYRIITKSGEIKSVEDFGRLVETDMHTKLFYVVLHDEVLFS